MVFLKSKILNKKLLRIPFIIFVCIAIFSLSAYAYLEYALNRQTAKADRKEYTVPYSSKPENAGIAFTLPDGSAVLTYLDFENLCIKILNLNDYDSENSLYYGYSVDYTVKMSYELIGGIIDRIGGINLEIGGETLRYTGVQTVELIAESTDKNVKFLIIKQIFEQISKNNFSKDDFIYIIENSKSDLSLIDCIYWLEYFAEMSEKITFVN